MERSTSLRWAALGTALGVAVAGALLFHHASVLGVLAVVPLAIGLGGLYREHTFGGFAALGGGALLIVAALVGELPAWSSLVGLAGIAVSLPAVGTALRYDTTAAAVWLSLAALGGSGAALAVHELDLDEDLGPAERVVVKEKEVFAPLAEAPAEPPACDRIDWQGFGARVDVDVCDGAGIRHRRHDGRHHRHPHRHAPRAGWR